MYIGGIMYNKRGEMGRGGESRKEERERERMRKEVIGEKGDIR